MLSLEFIVQSGPNTLGFEVEEAWVWTLALPYAVHMFCEKYRFFFKSVSWKIAVKIKWDQEDDLVVFLSIKWK